MTYHSEQVSDGFSVEKVSCKAYFLSSGHWTASMQSLEKREVFRAFNGVLASIAGLESLDSGEESRVKYWNVLF